MTDNGLTDAEQRAHDALMSFYRVLCTEVIGNGPTRADDTREATFYIHGLQAMLMSNIAARAFPGGWRQMGETIAASPRD